MIRHWKKEAHRNGSPVALYTTTTEQMIEADLALGYGGSLTFIGRQANGRRHPDPQANHHDFATAAFAHSVRHGLTLAEHPPMLVSELPANIRPLNPNAEVRPQLPAVYEGHADSPR